MANLRRAAAAGDKEAERLLALAENPPSPAFLFADLSKYRPQRG